MLWVLQQIEILFTVLLKDYPERSNDVGLFALYTTIILKCFKSCFLYSRSYYYTQKGPKSRKSCLYLKRYGSYWNVDFYCIRLKRGHAPPLFLGGDGKIFGPAFKSNAQKGLKSRKSCLYLKRYGSYWNVNFYRIRLKRGHAPPLFLGGGWKNFWSLIQKLCPKGA